MYPSSTDWKPENGQEGARPPAWHAGDDRTPDTAHRADARLRHRAAGEDVVAGCAPDRRELALPALQRLLLDGYVKAEWGTSENNRRARYYTLTARGRQQLAAERDEFERIVLAIQNVLRYA